MVFIQLTKQLNVLCNLLSIINDDQYTHAITHLGNASIGAHTRHIIELTQCAIIGHHSGVVDYINRKRDHSIESNREVAINIIEMLKKQISLPDKQLKIVLEEFENENESTVNTTYYREIVYNTEHTIHHLALIKVALVEMNLNIVSDDFGMAYSTIKFKASIPTSNN